MTFDEKREAIRQLDLARELVLNADWIGEAQVELKHHSVLKISDRPDSTSMFDPCDIDERPTGKFTVSVKITGTKIVVNE